MGQALAQRGFSTIVAGYRLSPPLADQDKDQNQDEAQIHARTQMHTLDVAQAVELVGSGGVDEHLGKRPQRLVLVGHSAGGQLVTLVERQARWLSAHTRRLIAGIVGIEGIYSLPLLAQSFPTYVDWFLIRAFTRDRAIWTAMSPALVPRDPYVSLEPAAPQSDKQPHTTASPQYLLVHAPSDSLVDAAQHQCFARTLAADAATDASDNVTIETSIDGEHDAILEDPRLHDRIVNFIKSLPPLPSEAS
eukprot:jgi/Hompol1/1757/HPOL_000013-RA